MNSLGFHGYGDGGLWGIRPFHSNHQKPNKRSSRNSSNSKHPQNSIGAANHVFPLKQAATAASLALTGDTIAQVRERWGKKREAFDQDVLKALLFDHNWLRALRMASYGFLLYGPGSYAWYKFLDSCMPKQTVQNVLAKVVLNQIVLGPCVIAVVFAWNNLWQGKLSELPTKYQNDALPTLLFGFRFWIPVSLLNFWLVPLQARVAFMSMGSIFWNFCLSSTLSK